VFLFALVLGAGLALQVEAEGGQGVLLFAGGLGHLLGDEFGHKLDELGGRDVELVAQLHAVVVGLVALSCQDTAHRTYKAGQLDEPAGLDYYELPHVLEDAQGQQQEQVFELEEVFRRVSSLVEKHEHEGSFEPR